MIRGTKRHVGTRQNREPDGIRILLNHRLDDLLGRLMKTRVDHLHAGIPKRPRDDLRATIVAVKTGLRDNDANLLLC